VANRILIDLGPLRRSRDFRLLFVGQLVGVFGSQLTLVAIAFQVYSVTRSSLQVGAVSLAQLVPLVLGALIGGTVGDAVDRRGILVVTSLSLGVTSVVLALNAALHHPSVPAIYLVSALAAGVGGVASTVCNAAVPTLVEVRHLVAAYASMQVVDQLGMVVAPALAGLLIGAVHLDWVYGLVAGVCVLTALTMARLPPSPGAPGASPAGLASILEGLRYLRGRPLLQGAFLIDINAMVFGMPRALFPALAVTVFHGGPGTLGYLFAAPGVGALLGALTTGWLAHVRRQACAVIVAVCVWGAAIVVFGVVHILWLRLALLLVAGWADVISAVLRTTILQSSIPEAFRSRLSSLQIAVVEGGPRLGDIESGAVAGLVSTGFSVVSGGVACVAGAVLLAAALPRFRTFVRPP
jgi:predicted MFS family arabinose efflux permease